MKLSKSLLQAILVGITLGSAATSCTKSTDTDPNAQDESSDRQKNNNCNQEGHSYCPACGMG